MPNEPQNVTPKWIRMLDCVSQFFNVLFYNGDSNYSISGESYRKGRIRTRYLIDLLFAPFESDHCRKAYLNDRRKAEELLKEKEID